MSFSTSIHKTLEHNKSHYKRMLSSDDEKQNYTSMIQAWKEEGDTVDFWRHKRLFKMIDPLLQPKQSWLTVGDGPGHEARYLQKKGIKAHASDLDDSLLQQLHQEKLIDSFSSQNAEKLTFADGQFEYILCKEAFHHFQRPYLALYEMLRVAQKAVVLIEPQDFQLAFHAPFKSIILSAVKLKKKILNQPVNCFEESGNFIYSLSPREMEKVLLGACLTGQVYIAYKGINDYYIPGVEYIKTQMNNPVFIKTQLGILIKNILSWTGFLPWELLCVILFVQKPSEEQITTLRKSGFKVKALQQNPYIAETPPQIPGVK